MHLMLQLASGRWIILAACLVLLAVCLQACGSRRSWRVAMLVLVFVGMAIMLLSGVAGPAWVWPSLLIAAAVGWAIGEFVTVHQRYRRWRLAARSLLALLVVLTAALEWRAQRPPSCGPRTFQVVYVLGDSVSAGIGGYGEQTWPCLIAQQFAVRVENLAMAGAIVQTALQRQAPALDDEAALVVIEIGGNDMLYGKPLGAFAQSLDELLATVQRPQRQIVMFELPSATPLYTPYMQTQRRLARKHGVALIPRKHFVDVIAASGSTLDGVHLTPLGHQRMAGVVAQLCGQVLERTPKPTH